MPMYADQCWFYIINDKKERNEDEEFNFYGKWLLFFSWEEVWEKWKKIAIAIENGEINSTQAKVSWQSESNAYKKAVCCVYTEEKDIEIVRKQLRKLGFVKSLCYKTNEATEYSSYGHQSHLMCERTTNFSFEKLGAENN